MSYAPPIAGLPLRVRYGTAVEPWHSLSLFYHYDTPLPAARDYTRSTRSLGQADSFMATLTPGTRDVAWMGIGMVVGAAIWNYGHQSAYRRVSRNRRRRR